MSQKLYFGDLVFEDDLVFAHTGNQKKIKFSKHERALLALFISHPGKLLTRDMLLNAVQHTEAETFDRNIDYLISRLRRKLNDSAHQSQFVATQYGEGYIWVAKQRFKPPLISKKIYLSIGPIYGLTRAKEKNESAVTFASDLMRALQDKFGKLRRIDLLPSTDSENIEYHHKARYALELSFLTLNDPLTCSLVVFNRKIGQILATFRYLFQQNFLPEQHLKSVAELAEEIKEKIVNAQIFRHDEQSALDTDPLPVGLYKAAKLFSPDEEKINEVEIKLRQHLREAPQASRAAILLATNIHSQICIGKFNDIESLEKEISSLILNHLDGIKGDALYLSAAAERLYELGQHELGETLAQKALELDPSLAACNMAIGRILILQGYIHKGLAYYDHCLEMTRKDSTFYHLLQLRKCIAYKALGDQNKVLELTNYLLDKELTSFRKNGLKFSFLADEHKSSIPELNSIATSKQDVLYYLKVLHYAAAKPFSHQQHRENILGGAVRLFTDCYGAELVPESIKLSVPNLFLS